MTVVGLIFTSDLEKVAKSTNQWRVLRVPVVNSD